MEYIYNDDYGVAIQEAVERTITRSQEIESRSKYHRGQSVRTTSDYTKLKNYFMKLKYHERDAHREAIMLAGNKFDILFVDELVDEDTQLKGFYYTIEDHYGFLFTIPEDYIEGLY